MNSPAAGDETQQEKAPRMHPSLWPYIILLIVLFVGWMLIVHLSWKPAFLTTQSGVPLTKLAWFALPPLIATIVLFVVHDGIQSARYAAWVKAQETRAAETTRKEKEALAQTAADKAKHQFALEVLGVGLTVESLRQTKVWEALKKGPHNGYVVPEKEVLPYHIGEVSERREDDALAYALDWFVEKWPIPKFQFVVQPRDPEQLNDAGLWGLWHRYVPVNHQTGEWPVNLLTKAFDLFDANADVPFAAFYGTDNITDRNFLLPEGAERLIPSRTYTHTDKQRTDTYVALALGRKERVDWLRPYATKAREGVRSSSTGLIEGRDEDFTGGEWYEPEWAGPTPDPAMLPYWSKPQAKPFAPTKWIPKPWRTGQLHQIDALPVLGYIHRPIRVSYLTPQGKPMGLVAREAAFLAGWKSALATLPDGQAPGLLFHNFGPSPMLASAHNPTPAYTPEWIVPLQTAVDEVGPSIDLFKEAYNLPKMLGEMGAATPSASIAIALMASFDEAKPSAVVMFDKDGATITMVRPPDEAERKKRHPAGGAPFWARQQPSSDRD